VNRASPTALEWTLRTGAFMCFVGHGAFGIMTKEAWVPYFAVVGIGRDAAYTLMPAIGGLDIAMGCLVLWRPRPAYLLWMTVWAVWTALLRPLGGEPIWEALERAGNYGVPAALLALGGRISGWRGLVDELQPQFLTSTTLARLRVVLAVSVLLLLFGHGALGVIGKTGLTANYASVVSSSTASAITVPIGWAEIVASLIASMAAWPGVLFVVAAWKLVTEALFLTNGASVWEWVERGGSYAAPIALAIVLALRGRAGGGRTPTERA
jgi:hypothetical protein